MNDPKKTSVPVCCICQKVINGDAEWIRTKRGLSQETCLLLVPGLCRPRSRGIGCTKKPVRYGVFLLCHFASKRPRFL